MTVITKRRTTEDSTVATRARNFLDECGGGAPGMAVVPGRGAALERGTMAPGKGHVEPGMAMCSWRGYRGVSKLGKHRSQVQRN